MDVDAAFGNWLAGFIDGEGSFAIRPGGGRQGYHSFCFFSLSLRIDDQAILREIQQRTNIGKLWERNERKKDHAQLVWQVSRGEHCVVLAELLEHYPLRAKKKKAFEIWKIALDDQMCHVSGGVGKRRKPDGGAHDQRMDQYKSELSAANGFTPAFLRSLL